MSAPLLALLALAGQVRMQGAVGPPPLLDVVYGEEPEQLLDLHLPAGRGFATVVFVYGGGWHSGSGKSCTPVATWLRDHGYACALPSHRLSPPHTWPAMIEDVGRAFRWVHEHVAEHGGDPRRIVLAGHSSGAQLALLLASDPALLAAQSLAPSDVRGVVGLSTPVDLAPRAKGADGCGYGDMLLAGHGADVFGRDVDVMRAASPLAHVTGQLPPTLLVVGERDFPMLADDARRLCEAAEAEHAEARLVIAPDRDHLGVVAGLIEPDDPTAISVLAFLERCTATSEPR